MKFDDYKTDGFYDEIFEASGVPREESAALIKHIESLPAGDLHRRQQAAEAAFMQLGITFTVYGSDEGTERIFPFDIMPRVIEPDDWSLIEQGLKQRIEALNLFVHDIYHDQKIVKDGIIPRELIESADSFRPECIGLNPPHNIWVPYHWNGFGAKWIRGYSRSGGQSEMSFWRLLCVTKPRDFETHISSLIQFDACAVSS